MNNNKMYDYLLNHSYISESKKSNYQSELSQERAECIANKYNSLIEEEKQYLIKYLEDKMEKWQKEFEYDEKMSDWESKNYCEGIIDTCQEILDKIKESDYEN